VLPKFGYHSHLKEKAKTTENIKQKPKIEIYISQFFLPKLLHILYTFNGFREDGNHNTQKYTMILPHLNASEPDSKTNVFSHMSEGNINIKNSSD
jgi:hypothetical protein